MSTIEEVMNPGQSVNEALAKIIGALPGIGRDQHADPRQGGYAYRGIEAISRAVQPLLAEHGVVIVPAVQSIDVKDITVANKPWTDTTLIVNYQIVGPDGSSLGATTVGIGRDNSDKGANKAMTQAYKYLLLQLLCVSDSSDDTDGTTHEAEQPLDPNLGRVDAIAAAFAKMDDAQRDALKLWAAGRSLAGGAMLDDPAWLNTVEAHLLELSAGAASDRLEQAGLLDGGAT